MQIPGVSDPKAQVLVQNGVMAIGDLVALTPTELSAILKVSEEESQKILENGRQAIEGAAITLQPDESEEIVSASAVPVYNGQLVNEKKGAEAVKGQDKFSDVEKRLREELAAFKIK